MKRLFITATAAFIMLFCTTNSSFGQLKSTAFTLKQAQDYALENAYKTRTANFDIAVAEKNRKQFITLGLPQINGSAKYNMYIDIPTQLMPNFLTPAVEGVLLQHGLIAPNQLTGASNDKFEVQFGSKHNFSGDLTASQLLFDGTFVVGLKAAAILVDLSKNAEVKSEIETREAVAQAYYLVLVAQANRSVLDSTLANMDRIYNQTKEFQKNGFMEETDVEQLSLIVSNLTNKRAMVDRQIELANDLLKFQMGIDLSEQITLTDPLEDLVLRAIGANLSEKQFDANNHIDFQIMKTNAQLLKQTLKVDQSRYYPTLTCFFTTSRSAQRNEFNFFSGGDANKWYKTTIFGVNLSVPLWSSGNRLMKIQADKLNIEKHNIVLKQVEQALQLEVQSARSGLKTYTDQYRSEINNMALSKKIYDKNAYKFKEGMSSSMELNQAYTQYLTTQGNYFNCLLELLNSYSKLNKALNNY
ncbi:MAG: TolC family protein [Bacteroidota bacterium]